MKMLILEKNRLKMDPTQAQLNLLHDAFCFPNGERISDCRHGIISI